jgi:predicted histidine transporter YuiF (NhaC family)
MKITTDCIIQISATLVALTTILATLVAIIRWYLKQEEQTKEIEKLKTDLQDQKDSNNKEQEVMCYALLACLDGLMQIGANGNVTKAHETLEKHLNQSAHERSK